MTEIDLRTGRTFPVLNQRRRPTCVACAVSAIHAIARSTGQGTTALAPEPIWAEAVARGEASHRGMPLWSAEHALTGRGQPALADWPYNPALGTGTESPPQLAEDGDWFRATLTRLVALSDGVEAELMDQLGAGHAVAVLIEMSDELLYPGSGGVVFEPATGFVSPYLHAVACVGLTDHRDIGAAMIVQNSWGPKWGDHGFGYVPLSYLRHWMACVHAA